MATSRTRSRNQPPDWVAFYKNGLPQEVIVIEDSPTPPPSSAQHGSGRNVATSPRSRAMPPPPEPYGSSQYHGPTSNIPAPTGRVTRRSNKRQASTDLAHTNPAGAIPLPTSRPSNGHSYAHPIASYSSMYNPHLAASSMYPNHALPTPAMLSNQNAEQNPPTKKKRKSNTEVKYIQPQIPQENYPAYYPPISSNVARPSTSSTGTPATIPPWDDKEGHYIVTPDEELTTRYKIIRLLGQGTFGKVVECMDRETGRHCAIKIIRAVPKYRDASKIEIRVLKTLKRNDPRNYYKCMHLIDCFDYRNHVCMVFELLGKSIYDWLKENSFIPFPPNQIQHFARQLLTSVAFLHRHHLIHTDLKPENILLVNNAFKQIPFRSAKTQTKIRRILLDPDIRLIDFGSATFQEEHHSAVVSTRHYRAPEIILGMGWSYPCDIWSIGCILVEFLTGEALFQTHDNLEHLAMMQVVLGPIPDKLIRSSIKANQKFFVQGRLDYPNTETKRNSRKYVKALKPLRDYFIPAAGRPENVSFATDFMNLLCRLMAYDPADRITAAEALQHPFFSYLLDETGVVVQKNGPPTMG